jgi:hypothetical protein
MIVSISNNKILWYEFLNPKLQESIIKEIVSKYPSGRFRDTYDVDDNSPMGQLLSAIDYLVDMHGVNAIEWINEKENLNSLLNNKELKNVSLKTKQVKNPTEYEDTLLRYGSEDLIKLRNNSNIQVLFENASYLAAKDFALKYLKENNFSKRVYIGICREWNINVVWVKK